MKRPEIYLEPKQRAAKIIELLEKQYPNAKTALNYSNPLEILVATMLSAQTTDERVNIVTQKLFKKYRTPEDYANVDIKELRTRHTFNRLLPQQSQKPTKMLPTLSRKIQFSST